MQQFSSNCHGFVYFLYLSVSSNTIEMLTCSFSPPAWSRWQASVASADWRSQAARSRRQPRLPAAAAGRRGTAAFPLPASAQTQDGRTVRAPLPGLAGRAARQDTGILIILLYATKVRLRVCGWPFVLLTRANSVGFSSCFFLSLND